jgi:hypothetical protein
MTLSTRVATRAIALVFATIAVVDCDSAREPSGPALDPSRLPPGATAAKAPTGLAVTAASPSFGKQGQTNEQVTITGTGFTPDANAAWLRNGVVDTTIVVTSTQYVSPTTLTATITISSKSPVDYRDIKVTANGGRTQGIGSLLFEVTQAVQIAGTSWVRSINDNGQATGTLASGDGVFYYSVQTGQLETVATTGTGYDIDTTGTTIIGSGGVGGTFPYVYRRVGGVWQGMALPIAPTSSAGVARSMLADGTGQAVLIGGIEYNGGGTLAVTWTWQAASGSWQRTPLPGNTTEVRHRAVSASGILGGTASAGRVLGPAVWMPNGSGGYALTALANAGAVNGVRADGGLLVGFTSVSVYWRAQPGGTWSAPVTVAGGCSGIKDIADAGRIILNTCPFATKGQTFAAYADAPYGSLSRLGGFGPKGNVGTASGISHGGHFAGGYASVNNQSVGIYWALP